VVGEVHDGSVARVLAEEGNWLRVRVLGSPTVEGWIADYYLRDRAAQPGLGQVWLADASVEAGGVRVGVRPLTAPGAPVAWEPVGRALWRLLDLVEGQVEDAAGALAEIGQHLDEALDGLDDAIAREPAPVASAAADALDEADGWASVEPIDVDAEPSAPAPPVAAPAPSATLAGAEGGAAPPPELWA